MSTSASKTAGERRRNVTAAPRSAGPVKTRLSEIEFGLTEEADGREVADILRRTEREDVQVRGGHGGRMSFGGIGWDRRGPFYRLCPTRRRQRVGAKCLVYVNTKCQAAEWRAFRDKARLIISGLRQTSCSSTVHRLHPARRQFSGLRPAHTSRMAAASSIVLQLEAGRGSPPCRVRRQPRRSTRLPRCRSTGRGWKIDCVG